jgi:hypothetical protein
VIKRNKYIKNKNFTQWAMYHTVYNSMLLENAPIDRPDLENHVQEVVGRLFDAEEDQHNHEKVEELYSLDETMS